MDHKEKKTLKRGAFIVFEGIDGTGKSTQLQLLAENLNNSCYPVVTTREPTAGQYGKKIRDLFLSREELSPDEELELFLLDRKEHVENLILPALQDNKIVLCDRYYLSTIAYQGAAGFDIEVIAQKNSFAPDPDLALIFTQTPDISIERITKNRGDVLNDFEQEDTLKKVAEIFAGLDHPFISRIEADKSIESVHEDVLSAVSKILEKLE